MKAIFFYDLELSILAFVNMVSRVIAIAVNSFLAQAIIFDNFDLPDYDNSIATEKSGLRRRFLDRKKEIQDQDVRLKYFDSLSNDSVYSEEILHNQITDGISGVIKGYETMFRYLLSMNGVKYVLKRDFHWRTWRNINYNDSSFVIGYKCQSYLNVTCAKCISGYWVIDEKPPCPFEIYSLLTPKKLCVYNYTQFEDIFKPCPVVITLAELLETCNNPVETKWRVIRNYSVDDNKGIQICQGKDNCEILTMYTIKPDSITFKIINSSHHIIYSRVMKADQKNYACVADCGKINPGSKAVVKNNDHHVVLDLFNYKQKKKRDDKNINLPNKISNIITMGEVVHKKPLEPIQHSPINVKPNVGKQKSACKQIQDVFFDEEDTNEYDY